MCKIHRHSDIICIYFAKILSVLKSWYFNHQVLVTIINLLPYFRFSHKQNMLVLLGVQENLMLSTEKKKIINIILNTGKRTNRL